MRGSSMSKKAGTHKEQYTEIDVKMYILFSAYSSLYFDSSATSSLPFIMSLILHMFTLILRYVLYGILLRLKLENSRGYKKRFFSGE